MLGPRGARPAVRIAEPVDDHRLLPRSSRSGDRRTCRARTAPAAPGRHSIRRSLVVGHRHLRSGSRTGPAVADSGRPPADRVGSCRRRCRVGGARPPTGGAARSARRVCGARCVFDVPHLRQGLVLPHPVGMVDHRARRCCRDLDRRRSDRPPARRSTPAPRPGRVGPARRDRRCDVDDARGAGGDGRRSRSAPVASAGSRCRPDGRRAGTAALDATAPTPWCGTTLHRSVLRASAW